MICLLIQINLKPLFLTNRTNEKTQIRNEDIQIVPSVKLLGITIADRLDFKENI